MTPRTDLAGYLVRDAGGGTRGDEDPATVLDRNHKPDFEQSTTAYC